MLDRSLFVPLYFTCEGRKLSAFFFIAKSPLTICESMIAIFCGQSNSSTDLSVFSFPQGEGKHWVEAIGFVVSSGFSRKRKEEFRR